MPAEAQPLKSLTNGESPRSAEVLPFSHVLGPSLESGENRTERPGAVVKGAGLNWSTIVQLFDQKTDGFLPVAHADNPEMARRARLICRFGLLGAVFGSLYAIFYVLIGHKWGALIVIVCSTGFGLMPWLMKRTGSLDIAGNAQSLILTLGFSALCFVEGGMNGHAIAWLGSVPLCALLLLNQKWAWRWAIGSFSAYAFIVALNFSGFAMKPTYDVKWQPLVSAAGYLGFILFMFLLGVIFETGRRRAFAKMQEALAELETSNAELTRLNQEKNEFLGIAAHDLRNPLGVVIGTAELLRICGDEKKSERMIDNIVGAGKRMLHLVKNLLDANAIEQGRFVSNLERCDLQSLVRECVDNNLATALRKEIRLQLESDVACWIKADRNATMQILDNLLSNAVKYSPRLTTVHVRTTASGRAGVLSIRDEGPGIGEDDMKRMFGKFTRLSARPTGGESSNGLGLSIVKRLAESMGGTVRCESELGKGAAFIVELPANTEV